MEPGLPSSFRHRKLGRRADYMPLESDSDVDSYRRSNTSLHHVPHRSLDPRVVLCDKCWLNQERARAAKRCLDCEQNLCNMCAKCDEVSRPWWVPVWLIQCCKCFFTDLLKPHSIVELRNYGSAGSPHWSHGHQSGRMPHIPRISRSSLRSSGGSNRTKDTDVSVRKHGRSNSGLSGRDRKGSNGSSSKHDLKQLRRIKHSKSYEQRPRKRSQDRNVKRSHSSEALVLNYRHDDVERLRRYRENWERAFHEHNHEHFVHSDDNTDMQVVETRVPFRNKFSGKDVMIELSNKDAKVIVNAEYEPRNRKRDSGPKKKSKRKSKSEERDKITEQIFEEVPIWFKKGGGAKVSSLDKDGKSAKRNASYRQSAPYEGNGARRTSAKNGGGQFYSDRPYERMDKPNVESEPVHEHVNTSSTNTSYLVEEPAESCAICLEELPVREARLLTCTHAFHTDCLQHLLYTVTDVDFGIKCPVCSHITYIKNYYVSRELWLNELPISTAV